MLIKILLRWGVDRMGNEIKTVLLKSVQLYDPDPKGICDLFLCGGRVAAVGRGLAPNLPGVAVLDGSGLTAFPGLVDQHVHFTGGGGECGFRSRVPELSLTDFTFLPRVSPRRWDCWALTAPPRSPKALRLRPRR